MILNKILQDPTRFYGILDKNAMESISIANKIKILQDPTRSYKILQDSTDTRQKCYGIHINSKQDPTRSYKILRDTRQKCYGIHINSKQDPTRSYLQDPTRFYGILDKNAMESISIANKILQDSTGY